MRAALAPALTLVLAAAAGAEERPLSLEEAVATALKGQPRLGPALAEREELARRGANRERALSPRPSLDMRQGGATDPILGPAYSIYRPYDRGTTLTTTLRLGVIGQVPQSGTQYSASVEALRSSNDRVDQPLSTLVQIRPQLELRQPLLRGGLGVEYRLAGRTIDQALSANEQQYLAETQSIILQVIEAYWAAARSARVVEIRKKALENAQQTLKATEALLAGGRATGEVVLTAKAEAARREQDVTEAKINETRALGSLWLWLQPDPNDAVGTQYRLSDPLQASEAPAAAPDAAAFAQRAVEGSRALKALALSREAAATAVTLAERALLPDLSINLRGGLTGLGGQSSCSAGFMRDGLSQCGVPPQIAQGTVSGAFTTLSRGTYNFWEAGLHLEAPFDDVAAWDAVASARRRVAEVDSAYALARQQLVTEALARCRAFELALKRAAEADRAAALAQQALAAVQARFRLGGATVFDVNRMLDVVVGSEEAALAAAFDLTLAASHLEGLEPDALFKRFGISIVPETPRR